MIEGVPKAPDGLRWRISEKQFPQFPDGILVPVLQLGRWTFDAGLQRTIFEVVESTRITDDVGAVNWGEVTDSYVISSAKDLLLRYQRSRKVQDNREKYLGWLSKPA